MKTTPDNQHDPAARRLNIAQEIARAAETTWEDLTLTKVEPPTESYANWALNASGTCWAMPACDGVEPKVGDVVRLYPGGFGFKIHGQDLNGEPIYFKTEIEREFDHVQYRLDLERRRAAEFEERRDDLDAAYDALPAPFRARLDRFRAGDATFRYESEGYESFVLVEAAKIAEAIPDADRVETLRRGPHDDQREAAPFLSDQHSGNTWGSAWFMAESLLRGCDV